MTETTGATPGKALGTKVCLRLINSGEDRIADGIYIPVKIEANNRLGLYEVISVGPEAATAYDLAVGDYVYADRLSVYYDTKPYCYMKYENLIVRCDKDGNNLTPFKDMAIVEEIPLAAVQNLGSLYVSSTSHTIPYGKITALNCKSKKYDYVAVGDKIVMTAGADTMVINSKKYSIYKLDMIIAKCEDE